MKTKSWLAVGLLCVTVLLVGFALLSGEPSETLRDPGSADAVTKPDSAPPPAETTRETTLPRQ